MLSVSCPWYSLICVCILWVSSAGSLLRIEKSALQVDTCSPAHGSRRLTWCPYWLHGELCLQKAAGPIALQLTGREALPQPSPCYHKPLIHVARLTCPCTEASHLPSRERTCLPLCFSLPFLLGCYSTSGSACPRSSPHHLTNTESQRERTDSTNLFSCLYSHAVTSVP